MLRFVALSARPSKLISGNRERILDQRNKCEHIYLTSVSKK